MFLPLQPDTRSTYLAAEDELTEDDYMVVRGCCFPGFGRKASWGIRKATGIPNL